MGKHTTTNRTLVLGVGNTLLADEGAGVHAMRYLQSHSESLPQTEFLDAGTLSFTLASDIAEADNLIIFDAAQINASPGTIRVFEGEELDSFLNSGRRSVHEVGFADLMDIARLQDCLPANRALIGIQPELLGWGDSTGESVTAAIPRAADSARALITKWLQQ
ncbi:MAG: HyaD/HybD family hydrogenase maturation endopeptidase [Gammaproteobacteria bacterium]|nr:HyaD/HybD family hydrogenase maturation endopeptidase [Gammaproteobacteria bacterium]MDH4314147.1 HyaD/HybD family hydrogenase maturation endopeptidase [Gammaproteobacteria bacterium]MDH5212787.1 HyaD/HybD family hydrogenase maturation endopeptidase [Gammaproteobacteria bacterium]